MGRQRREPKVDETYRYEDKPNASSASTTYAFRRVRITPAPQGTASTTAQPAAIGWRHLPRLRLWNHATVKLIFHGGSEGWIEVRARGSYGRYPGYVHLIDVLVDVNNCRIDEPGDK